MTAELAEGWLPLHYWPDRAHELWRSSLEAGRAARAADLPPLEIVAGGSLAIGDDVDGLRERDRPMLALYYGGMGAKGKNFYNDVLAALRLREGGGRDPGRLPRWRPQAGGRPRPRRAGRGDVLIGDAGFVKDRVAAYRESGVTVLNVQPVGPNGCDDIETIAGWVA